MKSDMNTFVTEERRYVQFSNFKNAKRIKWSEHRHYGH